MLSDPLQKFLSHIFQTWSSSEKIRSSPLWCSLLLIPGNAVLNWALIYNNWKNFIDTGKENWFVWIPIHGHLVRQSSQIRWTFCVYSCTHFFFFLLVGMSSESSRNFCWFLYFSQSSDDVLFFDHEFKCESADFPYHVLMEPSTWFFFVFWNCHVRPWLNVLLNTSVSHSHIINLSTGTE